MQTFVFCAILVSVPSVVALGTLALAIYAPAAQALAGYPAGEVAYRMLFSICHQYPLRCFWFLDHPMALCARCTGAYLGIAAGAAVALNWYYSLIKRRWQTAMIGVLLFSIGAGHAI
jgi:hypothetical protein